MILNGVIARVLRYFANSIAFEADYVTVVEDEPIMSTKYPLPLLAKLTHAAVSRSAIAELLVVISKSNFRLATFLCRVHRLLQF